MIETLLLPTDGSAAGKSAVAIGIQLAQALKARLRGLHVVDIRMIQTPVVPDISGSMGVPVFSEYYPVIEQGLSDRADAILAAFQEQCRAARIEAEVRKRTGIIAETIVQEGREADWIVLARRGEHLHLTEGALLGTTAESVVRHAGKPVLVAPQEAVPIQAVGLAYDASPPAQSALKLAAAVCRTAGWPLTLLVVASDEKAASALAASAERDLARQGIDGSVVSHQGKEDREIVRFAESGAVQLLVMGAYGHNRLRELILGSTTSHVIRSSPIPVLLTR